MYRPRSLKTQLLKAPFTFEFAQAAHILNQQSDSSTRAPLFFRSVTNFSPSASDILSIKPGSLSSPHGLFMTSPDKTQPTHSQLTRTDIYVNFFGLSGSHGPLPLAYTEKIIHNAKRKDTALKDFLDLFNHRLLSIFFRMKQKFYPVLSWSEPQKSFIGQSLSALTSYHPIKKELFPERSLLTLAQAFWKKPHTPEGLCRILAHHFSVAVRIIPFQGAWYDIPLRNRASLGHKHHSILGKTCVLGTRAWCQDHGMLICLDIHDDDLFFHLLPGGKYYQEVHHLITLYIGTRFDFYLSLSLSTPCATSLGPQKRPCLLGWTSWIGKDHKKKMTSVVRVKPRLSFTDNQEYTSSIV